jgi:hypothetical protein
LQSRRAAGGRYAIARLLLAGRCKKTLEFTSKRLKTSKSLAEIAHWKYTYVATQNIIVRCNMASLSDAVKNRTEKWINREPCTDPQAHGAEQITLRAETDHLKRVVVVARR